VPKARGTEARRAKDRGPKGREQGWGFGEGLVAPSPPARGSEGAL